MQTQNDLKSIHSVQAQQVSLDFVPLAALGALAAGAQVLMLVRDPFYEGDEILSVTFNGVDFFYQDRKIEQPFLKFVAGWAALPYKLPYLSSDPRFVSKWSMSMVSCSFVQAIG